MPTLSVLIPCYNERRTVGEIVGRVLRVPLDLEIIVVDDASTDGTREILLALARPNVRVLFQDRNRGKSAALRRALTEARGEFVIIQDADLEYDPSQYGAILAAFSSGGAAKGVAAVYGSRFYHGNRREGARVTAPWHYAVNRLLTLAANFVYGTHLTDAYTCYKCVRREVLASLPLVSERFGLDTEVTARLARLGHAIAEVPISYHPRSFKEGKKIGWRDGLAALWHILRFGWRWGGGRSGGRPGPWV